ncbi:DUF6620 family protein [Flavobacterium chungangense]|uniref:Uncharacterized protein n=1 Tax=Flavobacterium chungangense TaxID=554283 RepID=A0A6V6YXD5_9FLAO|nr:DUF6620 family protein [Flavobacterium chungangense]CAD0004143.1 hypothetical protein FLACHUCJ7_01763 [Flavobacterium chungangense]
MFKKLFGSLTGDNTQENQIDAQTQTSNDEYENEYENEYQEVEYDPETLHGTHYDVEDFDNEVETRAEAWIKDERESGENLQESDIKSIYTNYRREVYTEWNNCDSDQMIRFENANSLKYSGIQTSGFVKVDDNNPFLEPVHGISLRDYTAMCLKISAGVDYNEVCRAMGIESVIWEELNTIWPQRMGEDTSFTVTTLFGQYYAENVTVPQLENVKAEVSEEGLANLEKIKTDRYFYEELAGARQAAYEYGIDGAQWILDNYGINLADFQSVAMQWMTEQNQNWNSEEIVRFSDYQQEKQKEYAAKFAAEQGGNIADDVEF